MKARRKTRSGGFTLIELMVVMVVVGTLAAVALPSYTQHVVRTNRTAAAACLAEFANYMERYYTTNMRYDKDRNDDEIELPALGCQSKTSRRYTYGFAASQPTASTYEILATPKGGQLQRDTKCGTLSLNQTGQRAASGSVSATPELCW